MGAGDVERLKDVAPAPAPGATAVGFQRASELLITRAHITNRRLASATLLPDHHCDVTLPPDDVIEALVGRPLADECQRTVRRLIPKQPSAAVEYDLVVQDDSWLLFIPLQPSSRLIPPFPHCLRLGTDAVRLAAPPSAVGLPSARWLTEHVLPKLARWTLDLAHCADGLQSQTGQSLRLVEPELYHTRYQQLKLKYGPEFVKIWPENTDPQKFVYEDVAIATYLLMLWEQERQELNSVTKQSFVDVGCGNGLLVHILCSEGHPGYGVDVRSRKIWEMYPETTKLKVESINPSVDTAFPGCDWLIGNHSDELTPWIPVMAAASGPNTRVFLLPCCPWNFYSKYQRKNTRVSQYEEYLGYVSGVVESCGLVPELDRLRIPSTRRRCVVARRRAVTGPVDREALLQLTASPPAAGFTARPARPPVRNCSQLPADAVDAAVRLLADRLTDGRQLSLAQTAGLLGASTLTQLRQQCGGLKTLLRNHAQVFSVRGDCVQLQTAGWLRADSTRPGLAGQLKSSLCWLHANLPQGCPLPAQLCRFAHGPQDLRKSGERQGGKQETLPSDSASRETEGRDRRQSSPCDFRTSGDGQTSNAEDSRQTYTLVRGSAPSDSHRGTDIRHTAATDRQPSPRPLTAQPPSPCTQHVAT